MPQNEFLKASYFINFSPNTAISNYRCSNVSCIEGSEVPSVVYPGILFGQEGGGVQQIQLTTEDRQNGGVGAVAPSQGLWRQL